MSDPTFLSSVKLAFEDRSTGWLIARELSEALIAFIEQEGGVDGWRFEYGAIAEGDKVGKGGSVAELRAAWERHHLELKSFTLYGYGHGAGGAATYASVFLTRRPPGLSRPGSWNARLSLHGRSSVPLNTFAIDLTAALDHALTPLFEGFTAEAVEVKEVRRPERVPVGVAITAAASEVEAAPARHRWSRPATPPSPSQEKADGAIRSMLARIAKETTIQVVTGTAAAVIVGAYVLVATQAHWWPFLP